MPGVFTIIIVSYGPFLVLFEIDHKHPHWDHQEWRLRLWKKFEKRNSWSKAFTVRIILQLFNWYTHTNTHTHNRHSQVSFWLLMIASTSSCYFLDEVFLRKSCCLFPRADIEWLAQAHRAGFISEMGLGLSWFLAQCFNHQTKTELYKFIGELIQED